MYKDTADERRKAHLPKWLAFCGVYMAFGIPKSHTHPFINLTAYSSFVDPLLLIGRKAPLFTSQFSC